MHVFKNHVYVATGAAQAAEAWPAYLYQGKSSPTSA
jgi:hypothetical protein